MTQIHPLNAILQGFPSLWRILLARPQGVMWLRGAEFGTWQLRCTATTCHCIANKATVCSQLASLCTQPSRLPLPGQCKWETPFISGYQWTLRQCYPVSAPRILTYFSQTGFACVFSYPMKQRLHSVVLSAAPQGWTGPSTESVSHSLYPHPQSDCPSKQCT